MRRVAPFLFVGPTTGATVTLVFAEGEPWRSPGRSARVTENQKMHEYSPSVQPASRRLLSEGCSPASLEPVQLVLPGWSDEELWMREHEQQLQYALSKFEDSVSEFGMALVRLEALAAGYSELLRSGGGHLHHDD